MSFVSIWDTLHIEIWDTLHVEFVTLTWRVSHLVFVSIWDTLHVRHSSRADVKDFSREKISRKGRGRLFSRGISRENVENSGESFLAYLCVPRVQRLSRVCEHVSVCVCVCECICQFSAARGYAALLPSVESLRGTHTHTHTRNTHAIRTLHSYTHTHTQPSLEALRGILPLSRFREDLAL